jgi:hypothetical protein
MILLEAAGQTDYTLQITFNRASGLAPLLQLERLCICQRRPERAEPEI